MTHQIIAEAEFNHQRYVIRSSRSGFGWIVLATIMLVPAFLSAIGIWLMALFERDSLNLTSTPSIITGIVNISLALMITMNIALYLVVILITVALASNSINRERVGRTWDVLLLTNISARQLVWGKWRGSVDALLGDHMMIGLLRLGLVGMTFVFSYNTLHGETLPRAITHVLPLTFIMFAFTVLDAAFTAALGIAGSLSTANRTVTGTLIVTTRIAGFVLAAVYYWLVVRSINQGATYLVVGCAGLLIFALVIWLTLRVAQVLAVRGQVSP